MTVQRSQPSNASIWCPGCSREVEGACSHFNCAVGPNGLAAHANEVAALKARNAVLEAALQFIADGYDNHDVNHVDYRVKVYQVATDALNQEQPK